MKQLLSLLMLMVTAMNVGAASPDDCRKSLAMLDAAMQLEDVQLTPTDQLDAVVAECRATWPRYRGYLGCAKRAKGHDDLIACVDLWQRRLRRQRGEVDAATGAVPQQTGADGAGQTGAPVIMSSLQLSLRVTPEGVCWYDNRLFSTGAVLQMPGDGQAYRCTRTDGHVMEWMPGTKP